VNVEPSSWSSRSVPACGRGQPTCLRGQHRDRLAGGVDDHWRDEAIRHRNGQRRIDRAEDVDAVILDPRVQ
jgi:hypothetical protein